MQTELLIITDVFKPSIRPIAATCKQSDTGRMLRVRFMNGPEKVTVAGTVKMRAERPDGTTAEITGSVDGGDAIIDISNVLQIPGIVHADVTAISSSKRVSTLTLIIDVQSYAHGSTPPGEDIWEALETAAAAAESVVGDVADLRDEMDYVLPQYYQLGTKLAGAVPDSAVDPADPTKYPSLDGLLTPGTYFQLSNTTLYGAPDECYSDPSSGSLTCGGKIIVHKISAHNGGSIYMQEMIINGVGKAAKKYKRRITTSARTPWRCVEDEVDNLQDSVSSLIEDNTYVTDQFMDIGSKKSYSVPPAVDDGDPDLDALCIPGNYFMQAGSVLRGAPAECYSDVSSGIISSGLKIYVFKISDFSTGQVYMQIIFSNDVSKNAKMFKRRIHTLGGLGAWVSPDDAVNLNSAVNYINHNTVDLGANNSPAVPDSAVDPADPTKYPSLDGLLTPGTYFQLSNTTLYGAPDECYSTPGSGSLTYGGKIFVYKISANSGGTIYMQEMILSGSGKAAKKYKRRITPSAMTPWRCVENEVDDLNDRNSHIESTAVMFRPALNDSDDINTKSEAGYYFCATSVNPSNQPATHQNARLINFNNSTPFTKYDGAVQMWFDSGRNDMLYRTSIQDTDDGDPMWANWLKVKTEPFNPSTHNEAVEQFIAAMNRKASLIGMTNTTATSPNGTNSTVSTPRDMLMLTVAAAASDEMNKYWSKKAWHINAGTNEYDIATTVTDAAFGPSEPFQILCGKPGHNPPSGSSTEHVLTLVLCVRDQKGRGLAGVIMGANQAATETARLRNRYLAMRHMFDLAERKLDDPSFNPSASDLAGIEAAYACCCEIPSIHGALCEGWTPPLLVSKGDIDTVQTTASTIKVLTALTVLDYLYDPSEQHTIDKTHGGSGSGTLVVGDVVRVRDLMYALMLQSNNTAAVELAHLAGAKSITSAEVIDNA